MFNIPTLSASDTAVCPPFLKRGLIPVLVFIVDWTYTITFNGFDLHSLDFCKAGIFGSHNLYMNVEISTINLLLSHVLPHFF